MNILSPRLVRSAAALMAGAAIVLSFAGCASSADNAAGTSGGKAVSSDAEFSAARDAYDLKLAECMRGKGLDVKDPEPGRGIQESGEEFNAAASICMKELGDPPVYESPMSDSDALTMHLAWANCFRDRGFDVVDPQLGQVFVIPENATDEDIAACTDPAL